MLAKTGEADQLCLVNPTVAGLMYWGIVSILDHKVPKHCSTLQCAVPCGTIKSSNGKKYNITTGHILLHCYIGPLLHCCTLLFCATLCYIGAGALVPTGHIGLHCYIATLPQCYIAVHCYIVQPWSWCFSVNWSYCTTLLHCYIATLLHCYIAVHCYIYCATLELGL